MSNDVFERLSESLGDRYRIDREIGVGGMATVFLAHDLRHDRDVAIKVLHPDLGAALGADRFLSEIRTTARLQHPHILPLLDSGGADGLLYYVMPLVTGETLRARLDREKQLPIDDAIRIAREVADALAYAHELGVIHRDIKPENILLQGAHASVADFGIALAVQQAGGQRMTQTGLSLGTPQYMSPEQALGERTIDARSDIYALAAVTYEMLVGEAPFTGPTVQAILARVMSEEPRSLVVQRKAIPDHVDDAVMRGLEKLPADRWPSAREFATALETETSASPARKQTTASRRRSTGKRGTRLRDPLVLVLAGITLVSLLVAGWSRRTVARVAPGIVRFTIPAAADGRTNSLGLSSLCISQDGSMLVYVGQDENRRQMLMVRTLDDIAARPLVGSEDGGNPAFSPDGKWVAFIRANQLFKVGIDGSRPQMLASVPGIFVGMTWSTTGVIILSGNTALFTIPEGGGPPRQFLVPDRAHGEVNVGTPVVRDADGLLIYSVWASSSIAESKLAITSLGSTEHTVLDVRGVHPLGIVDGVLTYVTAGGAIMGVPIDVAKRKVTGPPVQLASDVAVNATSGIARASLAANGTLIYQSGTPASQVVSVAADGSTRILLADARDYAFPRVSPDGRQLAVVMGALDRRDVWLYDLGSQTMTRLTSEGGLNDRPEWTPDGKRVLYRSDRDTRSAIWWRPADLSAPAVPLIKGALIDVFEGVVSPDMRTVVYQLDTAGADIYYRSLSGDSTAHAIAANQTAIETMPRLSPDGRWVAFITNESGRDEVVVQPFPGPGGRVQVSAGGGSEPVWSRDGRRLFYRGDGRFMAAVLSAGANPVVMSRDTLFTDTFQYASNPHANYDVMADGTHFVFLKAASAGSMIVATNWSAGVRARMAGGSAR